METSGGRSLYAALTGTSRALAVALRPRQWSKNLLVYFAFFFTASETRDLEDPGLALSLLGQATLAFILFCALSGAVYVVNDLLDVEQDRRHPRKRLRPIAAGDLSAPVAWGAASTLALVGLGLSFLLEPLFGWVAVGYLLTMALYSAALKHVVLLDVFVVSGGFVLRAVAGAAVLKVPVSPWLYICTGMGALFIVLSKRRSELDLAGERAGSQRQTLQRYTTGILDQFIAIVAPSTLMAYTLYTFTAPNLPDNNAMMLTIPFVVYGLFRYLYVARNRELGESPEEILITDRPLIACVVLWLATAATVLIVWGGAPPSP